MTASARAGEQGAAGGLPAAVATAVRAPSVYNSQPWRWRIGRDTVDLFADDDRRLAFTDPDGNDLLLSCGAALHHLTVGLAAAGHRARVERFPDPEDSGHLARVRIVAGAPNRETAGMAPAVTTRRTDRRRFGPGQVDPAALAELVGLAQERGATLTPATGAARAFLIEMITAAADEQRREPGYAAELARWAGRYRGAGDGIGPASAVRPGSPRSGAVPMRPMPHAALAQSPGSFDHEDGSALLVLAAARGSRAAVLRAGEALSAVLLTATARGLATTPLSQPMEVGRTRDAIGSRLTGPVLTPLIVLRVGHPAAGCAPLPPSPRRSLRAVLTWSPDVPTDDPNRSIP